MIAATAFAILYAAGSRVNLKQKIRKDMAR